MTKLTVYANNFAFIKEQKTVDLKKGDNQVVFDNVAASLQQDSVFVSADGAILKQYSYCNDALTPGNLLKKSLGCKVKLIEKDKSISGRGTEAVVAGNKDGIVFSVGGKMLVGFNGQVIFNSIPETISIKPKLTADIYSKSAKKKRNVDLYYLASSISWKTSYVASLYDNGTLDLTAYVALDNKSGCSYKNADVVLLAGDVNKAYNYNKMQEATMKMRSAPPLKFEQTEDEGGVYHSYALKEKINIEDNENKSILLFEKKRISYEKEYVIDLRLSDYPGVTLLKQNPVFKVSFDAEDKDEKFILPKGIVRGYTYADDNVVFIGEDNIRNTGKGEKNILTFGNVFDITAEVRHTVTSKTVDDKIRTDMTTEILLKNSGNKDAVVKIKKLYFYAHKLVEQNIEYERSSDGAYIYWKVPVLAGNNSKLLFKYYREDPIKRNNT